MTSYHDVSGLGGPLGYSVPVLWFACFEFARSLGSSSGRPSSSTMVSITVSSARPSSLTKGFPLTLDLPENATVADVKAAVAKKLPKVSLVQMMPWHTLCIRVLPNSLASQLLASIVLYGASKALVERKAGTIVGRCYAHFGWLVRGR